MNTPEAGLQDTEKSLDDLYDTLDWSACPTDSRLDDASRRNVRCNFLNMALYSDDSTDRVRARLFLGPIWTQVLAQMREWGLIKE